MPSPQVHPYRDIARNAHLAAILRLDEQDIMDGCTPRTFCPNAPIDRALMAKVLAAALDVPTTSRDFFRDDDGNAHEANINRLAASSITLGCTIKRFCVAGTVRRGQLASFVSRALTR